MGHPRTHSLPASLRDTRWRWFTLAVLYSLASSLVLFIFIMKPPGIHGAGGNTFPDMIAGTARKPFVFRQLIPTTVRLVAGVIPTSVTTRLQQMHHGQKRGPLLAFLQWEPARTHEYLVAALIAFGCFFAFACTLRYLIGRFYDFPSFVSDLAPIGALLILPVFFRAAAYIYDPATLCLSTLAVACMVRGAYPLFYLVFALAAFNKETSILLIPLFMVHARLQGTPRVTCMWHGLFLGIVWGVIKGYVTVQFRGNRGGFVEFHLLDHNLRLLGEPVYLFYFILVAAAFAALIRHGWGGRPLFLRAGLGITLVPLLALALFLGYIDELRGYYEAVPFLFLLALPTVVERFGIVRADRPD